MIAAKIKPNLVSSRTLKRINKIFSNPIKEEPTWGYNMGLVYSDYIRPNLFPLIVLFIITVFLSIRYLLKKEKDNRVKQNKHKSNKKKYYSKQKNKKQYKIDYGDYTDDSYIPKMYGDEKYEDNIRKLQPIFDTEDEENDEMSIYGMQRKYRKEIESSGDMSDEMINELMETKSSKISFDEIARIVAGQ